MKQINPRYPGSESLRRMDLLKEDEESIQQLFILLGFICRLQLLSCVCAKLKRSLAAAAAVLPSHMNNKLKAVKFRHCDYQYNYIIELKTEVASCKMCYQNAVADIMARVPQCARRLRMPEFKDFCEILGYNESWSLVL